MSIMEISDRFYGRIEKEDLHFDVGEVASRLKIPREYTHSAIEKCKNILLDAVDCKYCGVKVSLSCQNNIINICGLSLESSDLARNLGNAEECFVFAVTLGSSVDRLLKKYEVLSPSEHYILDALASALAENAADKAESIIKGNTECRPRFSPGYGDLSIENQKGILSLLDGGRRLGITLSSSYLMTPQKSITAIMGIKR